jgi:hypothetical protein
MFFLACFHWRLSCCCTGGTAPRDVGVGFAEVMQESKCSATQPSGLLRSEIVFLLYNKNGWSLTASPVCVYAFSRFQVKQA